MQTDHAFDSVHTQTTEVESFLFLVWLSNISSPVSCSPFAQMLHSHYCFQTDKGSVVREVMGVKEYGQGCYRSSERAYAQTE